MRVAVLTLLLLGPIVQASALDKTEFARLHRQLQFHASRVGTGVFGLEIADDIRMAKLAPLVLSGSDVTFGGVLDQRDIQNVACSPAGCLPLDFQTAFPLSGGQLEGGTRFATQRGVDGLVGFVAI